MDLPVDAGPPPQRGNPIYRADFPGSIAGKNRAISEVLAVLLADGRRAADPFRLRICLDEAIQNAIDHGNGGDAAKVVSLTVLESAEGWEVLVRDQGRGFLPEEVPDPRLGPQVEAEGGRGLLILREYMDSVRYYEGGRTLVLGLLRRGAKGGR